MGSTCTPSVARAPVRTWASYLFPFGLPRGTIRAGRARTWRGNLRIGARPNSRSTRRRIRRLERPTILPSVHKVRLRRDRVRYGWALGADPPSVERESPRAWALHRHPTRSSGPARRPRSTRWTDGRVSAGLPLSRASSPVAWSSPSTGRGWSRRSGTILRVLAGTVRPGCTRRMVGLGRALGGVGRVGPVARSADGRWLDHGHDRSAVTACACQPVAMRVRRPGPR